MAATVALVPLLSSCRVTTEVTYGCSFIPDLVTVVDSDATPDSLRPGERVTNVLDITLPAITTDVPVNYVRMAYRLPDRLDPGSVTASFAGGNLSGSYAIDGDTLALTFNGFGVSSLIVDVPTITLAGTVRNDAYGGTMAWPAPEQVFLDVDFLGTPLTETCTVQDGTPEVNNTNVEGPPGPITTTTSRVTPTSPTSVPTTPSSVPTTPSTAPTTTTTRPWPTGVPAKDAEDVYDCSIVTDMRVGTGTTHAPEPVAPGGTVRLTTVAQFEPWTTDVPIEVAYVHYPVPAGLTVVEVDAEVPSWGPANWEVVGSELVVAVPEGGRSSSTIDGLPVLTITARVADGAEGSIVVPMPSRLTFDINFLGTPIVETCTKVTSQDAPVLETITVR